jgi:trigger factor
MQSNLETLGVLQRRLSVAVPIAEIESEVESRLKRLSRTVKLHGFRPGKVPMKVVAQQFGPQVRQEVLGDTVEKTFGEAVKQQNLKVAGYPKFEAKPVPEGANDFEYSATFEVYPEVKVGDISGKTIERAILEVTDAEVEKTIEIMRKQRATFEPVERAAQVGDRLAIDYNGTIGGDAFDGGSAQGATVIVGSGRMLPAFDQQLVGIKAGEVKSFELRFPDDYHGKEVAGKTAHFEVAAKEVAAPKLPELDAEFAKSVGVSDGDLAQLHVEVKDNLQREVKLRLKNRVKDQAMQALLDVTRIDVPRSLVDMEIERMQAAARQDLKARGVKADENTPMPAELFEKQAARRVNLGLILAEVVRQHALYPKPEQVRAVVEEQAKSYEHPQEVVKWFYGSPERLREIESAVLEDNVVEWALATAKAEDKLVAFDELMGNQQ